MFTVPLWIPIMLSSLEIFCKWLAQYLYTHKSSFFLWSQHRFLLIVIHKNRSRLHLFWNCGRVYLHDPGMSTESLDSCALHRLTNDHQWSNDAYGPQCSAPSLFSSNCWCKDVVCIVRSAVCVCGPLQQALGSARRSCWDPRCGSPVHSPFLRKKALRFRWRHARSPLHCVWSRSTELRSNGLLMNPRTKSTIWSATWTTGCINFLLWNFQQCSSLLSRNWNLLKLRSANWKSWSWTFCKLE